MKLLVMKGTVKGRAGNGEGETKRTKWFCIIIKKWVLSVFSGLTPIMEVY